MTDQNPRELQIIDEIDSVERSVCDCKKCQAGCETAPAACGPGDIDKIAEYWGVNRQSLLVNNFELSEGAIVRTPAGDMKVPGIVPQRKSTNGSCIFFANGKCTIHPVSPYGCRNFRICEDESKLETQREMNYRSILRIVACAHDRQYQEDCQKLDGMGIRSSDSTMERKERLQKRLKEIE